jgi:hypothetical protein
MSDVRTVYAKARAETAKLLGHGDNLEQLTAEQSTRLDIACALRIALDDSAAKLLRGETSDVSKLLSASEALSRLLPAAVLASPPEANAPDPREIMWQTYLGMRKCGELFDPCSTFEGMKAEVERLRARVAELEAGGAPAPADSVAPETNWRAAPDPVGNVVPLPRATAGKQNSAQAPPPRPAPSTPVAGELVMVVDASPQEPWRDYVEPTGEIRSTPRGPGRYWGPV